MDSIKREAILAEINEEWSTVAAAVRRWAHWVMKGRYRIDKEACAPRERINMPCAVGWGVEPHLAKRLLES